MDVELRSMDRNRTGLQPCISVLLARFGALGVLIIIAMLLTLLGCKTTNAPVPMAKDLPAVTNTLRMVVSQVRKGGQPLRHVVGTRTQALTELRILYPQTQFFESCEYDGWFIFSTTPADNFLRFHNGYAVEKNGTRVAAFGFW